MTAIALRNGQTLITGGERHDSEMGAQLTEQYERATGGMREVLKFGCMMMMLRAHIISTRGNDGVRTGGAASKDTGIKAWIEQHAPKVKLSTAYRFEDVAKSVAAQFELPGRVAKTLTFEQLVTTDEKDLPANARKTRSELFDFVAGTSQRSWLDQFKSASANGGTGGTGRKKLTREQIEKDMRESCVRTAEALHVICHDKAFYILNEAELDGFIHYAETAAKEAKAWRNKTKREREQLAQDQLAELCK